MHIWTSSPSGFLTLVSSGAGGLGGAGGVTVPGDCEGPLTGQEQAAHYQQQVEMADVTTLSP